MNEGTVSVSKSKLREIIDGFKKIEERLGRITR